MSSNIFVTMDLSFAVRKGTWTEEEDLLLRRCIEKYGEGKWHQVPLRAGLRRCRKSCRLRWLNYLRPNIKKGEFTHDEVDLLLRLHKLLGNRWSLIAGRLPGRTANDIKNFWNTRFNRRTTSITASEREEVEAKSHVSNKNEVIKPRPWTFPKNSPWLLGSLSFSTSPNSSATNITASEREEVEAKIHVSNKNEVIKPRPWTFPKNSPWLLESLSFSTSPNSSATNAGSTSQSSSSTCPILPSTTGGSRLEQERDSFDKELEKGTSGSVSASVEDLITSLCVEDLQPMIQVENDYSFFEEGSIFWDDDFYLDFNFWDTPVIEGELLS